MAKNTRNYESSDGLSLGTDAWNISDGFTKGKILEIIYRIDIDEKMATFGKRDDYEQIPREMIAERRVDGLSRLIFDLRQLIGNCRFAIEKGFDEIAIQLFLTRLDNVEEVFDGIADWKFNDLTKENTLTINEIHFKKCFKVLRSIKDELNFILNRAGLIFRKGDTLDLDDIMRNIEDGN